MSSLRTFYLLTITQVLSLVGSGMTSMAVGIQVFSATGDTSAVLLASFFTALPMLVAGSFAGVLVDRWDRRGASTAPTCSGRSPAPWPGRAHRPGRCALPAGGVTGVMTLDLATFAAVAAVIARVPTPRNGTRSLEEDRASLWADYRKGLRFLRRRPKLLFLMLSSPTRSSMRRSPR